MNNSFCMSLGYLLRTSDKDLDGQTIASVCITGVAVVFVALVILIALVTLYGKVFDMINTKAAAKAEAEKKAKEEEKPAVEKKTVAEPVSVPIVQDGIEEEVVAVIMAAVSAYGSQSGKKLTVKNIRLSGGTANGRSAWSSAGLSEATRPF